LQQTIMNEGFEETIQPADIAWATRIAAHYRITSNVVYADKASTGPKLDLYQPREMGKPRPALLFMHAGGWGNTASKETWALWFLPFLQLGWIVANVGYRPANIAPAPAAVEDCLCALRWLRRNAEQLNVDATQIVIAGISAGGHLALTTAMIPAYVSAHAVTPVAIDVPAFAAEFLREPAEFLKPLAVVNWCGITDVADLLVGRHQQEFALRWLGERTDRAAFARAMSPLTYVNPGLPPVITVHGDNDQIVPHEHATRLHEALSRAGVINELLTIPGGEHGSLEAYLQAYPRIFEFLERAGARIRPR
jgi:acetyl esterase/lipase